MLDPDLPPPPPLVVNPPMKKFAKSLKPLKTTRTMNLELRNTMKHDDMLGESFDVTFKKVNTRSRSKGVDSVMVSEGMVSREDANDVSTCKQGLIEPEVSNGIDINRDNNRSGESTKVKMVSNPSFVSNVVDSVSVNDCLDKNCGIKPKYTETMFDIPVSISENPILNHDFRSNNKPKSPVRVSFREVRRLGMFKVSGVDLFKEVQSVSNFEVGERNTTNGISIGDKGSVKKPFSFMSALTGDKVSGNNKLRYVAGSVNRSGREVAKIDLVIEDGSIKWNMTVIGHFVGYRMSYKEIMGNLRRMWRPYHFDDIIMNNNGLICMFKPEVTKVLLWVKIYNVPLEAWNVEGISKISSRVGNPIIMDRITTTMCERSYGRASFARVLVEVNFTKGLVDTMEVWYRSLGKSMILDVECAWRPLVCEHCKIFGHTLKSCSAKDLTEEEKSIKETMKPVTTDEVNTVSNDGWKSVRGNGISRQYVPFKNNERSTVNKEEDLRTTKKDHGNNDSMDKMNKESIVKNVSRIVRTLSSGEIFIAELILCVIWVLLLKKKRKCPGLIRKGCRIIVGWDPFMLRARLISKIDQVMHFEVTFLHNQLKLFVFCIYAHDAVKDRRTLWKNLIDHKILASNSPWKTKIEWLRERDHNTAYFHKVLKGWVCKSTIEVITNDAGNTFYGDDIPAKFMEHFKNFFGAANLVFPIEDCCGLFTKKLDPQVSSVMIRPVLDEEIRAAMFDIKDDKDAGPDGFTLKFFKKAGAIMSPDGFTSVAWNDICVPKSQGGLGLRSIKLLNEGLKIKYLWNIISNKDSLWVKCVNSYRLKGKCVWTLSVSDNTAWCWRHILKLRDKIRDYVGFKVGNGKSCFIWFDKWQSNGPLCMLITHNLLYSRGFDVTDKVVDKIQNNMWTCPRDWTKRFKDVLDVPVPVLNEFEDKTIWFNKKFKEINFSVKEVCNVLRSGMPSFMWHEHVWLKLLSFDIKWFRDVGIAAKVWQLPNLGLKGSYRFLDDMDIDDSFLKFSKEDFYS
nr:hypothetical protein [Tanacetum cinerariifolium]